MRLFLLIGFICVSAQAFSNTRADTSIILLSDLKVQLEANQALNDMYNFKFDLARKQFNWLKEKYPWHPLPYFLLGLNEWWKIMPNMRNKDHDEIFFAYMDTVIMVANKLYLNEEYKLEATFFLSAANGFKGRLYSDEDRKNWRKSAVVGKEAMDYLEEVKEKNDLSPELLFGDGLYNYFSVWIPENYPILRPIMIMFPKGDKELGIKQLREVSFNAFYTRIEAMVFLMQILHNYENDAAGAFHIGEYLHSIYPDNSYFHRYYARLLYSSGRFTEAKVVSEEIMMRIDSGYVGYDAASGRYASFFLGHINQSRGRLEEAKKYFLLTGKYSEEIGATDTGYYYYSILNLGRIAEADGEKEAAKEYYKKVKDLASRKDKVYKEAKERLKKLK
ncbi:MAG: tetratricopeptide repeat protein [Cyclobacteriaceae bacterium]|nr:tetratricopeptide repeat protein [Cyclobacteriaceae bacterium]